MNLSDREADTVRLILEGHTYKTAARELGISAHTVKKYGRAAMLKLGASNRATLAVIVTTRSTEASNRRMDRAAA